MCPADQDKLHELNPKIKIEKIVYDSDCPPGHAYYVDVDFGQNFKPGNHEAVTLLTQATNIIHYKPFP